MDIGLISAAVATALAPFTPFLVDVVNVGGKKLVETINEKGGEVAWNKAQQLWKKIESNFGSDPKVKGAALMVSAEPDDEASQTMLAAALATHLKEDQNIAKELFDLIGRQDAVQKVLADRKSWVNDVTQQINGGGQQIIKADRNSRIKGVRQIKK